MKIKHISVRTLSVRRYHVLLVIICVLLFSTAEMFSSHEKQWLPYTVALTFDDGPHPYSTRRLLTILAEYEVPSTFFFVGKQIDKYPDLVMAAVSRGHDVGNHTYNHHNLTTLSEDAIVRELRKTQFSFMNASNKRPFWFRPPGGNYDERIIRIAKSCGYTMVLWDIKTNDHCSPDPSVLRATIMNSVSNNSIILLHSGIDATLECLPDIITDLRARGYAFVTISEIMAVRKITDHAVF